MAGSKQQLQMLGGNHNDVLLTDTYNFPQMFRQSSPGSSDLGDVTWIAPLGQVLTTCAPLGVQVHTWQATASFGSKIGMKGMHYAAKTMAGAALDTLLNPDIIAKAKEEFNQSRGGVEYKCAIPKDVKPPKPTKAK